MRSFRQLLFSLFNGVDQRENSKSLPRVPKYSHRHKKQKKLWVGHFMILSDHFLANYLYVFHKIELQTIILMCLTCLNLFWIKSYNIKHNFCHILFLQFCKKNAENSWLINGHFRTISGHNLATTWSSFTKKKFRQSFWDA